MSELKFEAVLLPQPTSGDPSAMFAWAQQLTSILQLILQRMEQQNILPIYDNHGNVIINSDGVYVYGTAGALVTPSGLGADVVQESNIAPAAVTARGVAPGSQAQDKMSSELVSGEFTVGGSTYRVQNGLIVEVT